MYTSFPSTTLFGSIGDSETIQVTEAGDAATRAAGDRAAVRDCRGQRRFAILDQHAHAVAVDRAGIVDRAARRQRDAGADPDDLPRSEEHTSELQSLMRTTYTIFCLKTKKQRT